MTSRRLSTQLLLSLLCASACVTQTERRAYYPHARYKEDSLGTELRREFGWQTDPQPTSREPLYRRAARDIRETVSGWFHEEGEASTLTDEQKLRASRRQFEQERQEALRRLQAQQELNQLLGGQ